ncbi:MAG: hypothetical protein M1819_006112 [Sarea resinae]|nr:MAG: hypothetical protein M1819_006112 [Sarea resinae]
MEAAIRWSPLSTAAQQHFILVDVGGHKVKLCEAESTKGDHLQYRQLSQHSKIPDFRAFDWNPVNEGLLAVGLPSGAATVLRIDNNSNDSFSFPIKNQRYCNAIAFSTQGLLAAGLDKVRNDFCLNVWNVDQRNPSVSSAGSTRVQADPIRKLCTSEAVSSVKFFMDRPNTLVAGVGRQFIRIFDLKEPPGSPSLQFVTRRVNYLSIDPLDENYFASAGSQTDTTVCIWDRRFSPASTAATLSSGNTSGEAAQTGAVLEFKNAIDTSVAAASPSIWSVRFSKTKRGCVGVLSSTGELRVYETAKQHTPHSHGAPDESMASPAAHRPSEDLYTRRIRNVRHPYYDKNHGEDRSLRSVSFDFMTTGEPIDGHRGVILHMDGRVKVFELMPPPPDFCFSSRGELVKGKVETDKSLAKECAERREGMFRIKQTDFSVHSPSPSARQPIAEAVKSIRAKIDSAQIASELNGLSMSRANSSSGQQLSSRQAHEKLYSLGPRGYRLSEQDALTLLTIAQRRCEEGYLFDYGKNIRILADDPWLQEMWSWIGRMDDMAEDGIAIHGDLDLSYLGVYSIWHNTLGPNSSARRIPQQKNSQTEFADAVKGVNRNLGCPPFDGVKSANPEQRQLALAICGWALPETQLKALVQQLVQQGKHTKAAAWALFNDRPKLAVTALSQKSATEGHRLLAMGIAAYNNIGGAMRKVNDEGWTNLCKDIADSLQDPYSRAILALVSDADWGSVIQETSLPLRDRVGVALRYLDDKQLTRFLDDLTADAIRHGDIEGIVLTGLTEKAMDLFQNYIAKFNDVQTAVLAMSFVAPAYINDYRFLHWREHYRALIDSWKLYILRVRFDVQSTKKSEAWDNSLTIEPPPRQITLRCNYCDGSLAYEDNEGSSLGGGGGGHGQGQGGQSGVGSSTSTSTATAGGGGGGGGGGAVVTPDTSSTTTATSTSTNRAGVLTGTSTNSTPGTSSGTACPRCGRHLPRCGVCMMWLGSPDPSKPGASTSASAVTTTTTTTTAAASTGPGAGPAVGDTSANAITDTITTNANGNNITAATAVVDSMAKFIVFCMSCSHGFHAHHARDWFALHKACPVPDCLCHCARHH